MWTKPTFAVAVIADAALVCVCGTFRAAAQHMSSFRTFAAFKFTRTDTAFSPRLDPTTQTRTNRTNAAASIADAALPRNCRTLIVVIGIVCQCRHWTLS